MNSPVPACFKVGVAGVRISDLARLEAFLPVCKERTQAEWTLVSEGGAHVWLVGGDTADTVRDDLDPPWAVVPVVRTEGSCPEGALRSPVQLEPFLALLHALEAAWGSQRAAGTR